MPEFIDKIKAEQFLPPEKVPHGVIHYAKDINRKEWFGLVDVGNGFVRNIKPTDWVVDRGEDEPFDVLTDTQINERYKRT